MLDILTQDYIRTAKAKAPPAFGSSSNTHFAADCCR